MLVKTLLKGENYLLLSSQGYSFEEKIKQILSLNRSGERCDCMKGAERFFESDRPHTLLTFKTASA